MFNIRLKLKSFLANIYYYSGIFENKLNSLSKDHSVVLMYHRIIPRAEGGLFLQPGMYVEPATFDSHLCFIERYFDIRPLYDLLLPHNHCQEMASNKHKCYLTFDDGWCDFFNYAFPLLAKHRLPATVFLPTDFIGTKKSFWTERLIRICTSLLLKGQFIEFKRFAMATMNIGAFSNINTAEDFIESLICTLKEFRDEYINDFIERVELSFGIDVTINRSDFLEWKEIEHMLNTGLITFGSHTVTHRILTTLNEIEISYELRDSKLCLEARNVVPNGDVAFCYPNGNFSDIVVGQLIDNDYCCAFTTVNGWNNSSSNLFKFRRIGLHQDISSSDSLLSYRILSPFERNI